MEKGPKRARHPVCNFNISTTVFLKTNHITTAKSHNSKGAVFAPFAHDYCYNGCGYRNVHVLTANKPGLNAVASFRFSILYV